jgi:hypothetical protein
MKCYVCDEVADVKIKLETNKGIPCLFLHCPKCDSDYADHVILKMNVLLIKGEMNYEELLEGIEL